MKLTPTERRKQLNTLIHADPDCRKLLADYTQAQEHFTALTDRLPRKLQEYLWKLPGSGYFLHHRILTLVCEHMRFIDETESPQQELHSNNAKDS